jgi:pilus assembly protein CpaB
MKRPFLFFLLSGIAAMLAALVVYSALQQREAAIRRAAAQSVSIVVAARALPIGAKIDASAVKLVQWPRDAVPSGSYTDQVALEGAYVKDSFVENEPMVASKLFMGQKSAGVMPLLIPPGMRAMSVPVDKVSDVAGFVQPRTRVDVLVAMSNLDTSNEKPFAKTILENVEVLAVNQEIQGDPAKPQVVEVVTLLVTPQEAERLALASRQGGNLRLAIRSYDDSAVVLTSGSNVGDLEHVFSPAPPPVLHSQSIASRSEHPVRPPPVGVRVYRDGKTSEWVSFIKASDETFLRRVEPGRGAAPAAVGDQTARAARRDRRVATRATGRSAEPEPDALMGAAPAVGAVAARVGVHDSEASAPGDPALPGATLGETPKTIVVP